MFANNDKALNELYEKINTITQSIGLEINKEKTASNLSIPMFTLMEHEGYKYLGILETHEGKISIN